jgi:peptidoglycan hydrolase CwlO-like protein
MKRPTRIPSIPLALSLAALVVALTSSAWGSTPVSQSNTQVTTTPTVTKVPGVTNAQLKKKLDSMSTRLDKLVTKVTNLQNASKARYQTLVQQGLNQAQRQINALTAIIQSCQKANNDAREVYSASTSAPWLDIGSCPRVTAVTTPSH